MGLTTTYRFGSVPSLDVSTPSNSFSRRCTTFRSTAVIGSSSTRLSRVERPLGAAHGQPFEHHAAALAISRCIDGHLDTIALATRDDRVDDVLHRVDRLSVPADQHADVATDALDMHAVGVLANLDPAVHAELGDDPLDERAHVGGQLALALASFARHQSRPSAAVATTRAGA